MGWLLPFGDSLGDHDRRLLNAIAVLTLFLILGTTAAAAFSWVTGVGGDALEAPVRDWAPSLAYLLVAGICTLRAVRVADGRAALGAISGGLILYALGNVLYAVVYQPHGTLPVPSLCDALWLPLYPLSYLG